MHSINKSGQSMGRKGLESRQRLLAATRRLIEAYAGTRITASSIAREAKLASQTFYLYFKDVDDIILTLCEGASANAEDLPRMLDGPWRDDEIDEKCHALMEAFYQHWDDNRSLLAYRNFRSDAGDARFIALHHNTAMPMVTVLAHKLSGNKATPDAAPSADALARAVVVFASMERLAGRPDHVLESNRQRFQRDLLITAQADILAQLIRAAHKD